jgi:hypothetical protein
MNQLPQSPYYTAPNGWVCPKCNRVYSPSTSECWSCNNDIQPWKNPITCTTAGSPIGYCPPNTGVLKEDSTFKVEGLCPPSFPALSEFQKSQLNEILRKLENPIDKKDK